MRLRASVAATALAIAPLPAGDDGATVLASTVLEAADAGRVKATAQRRSATRDRGEASMHLGEIEWKGTSARARMKKTTLVISASRLDGSTSSRMVRQSIELMIPEYAGPGPYEAALGSLFLVVGVDTGGTTDSEMNAAMLDALTKAKHLQLEGAQVVIESASDTEIVGHFSLDRGPVVISDGRFRALVKTRR